MRSLILRGSVSVSATVLLVSLLISSGCDRRRDATESAEESDVEERHESALQEYVNEPKRRAKDAKSRVEDAQAAAAAAAERIADE